MLLIMERVAKIRPSDHYKTTAAGLLGFWGFFVKFVWGFFFSFKEIKVPHLSHLP